MVKTKLTVLGLLSIASIQVQAHPGHADNLLEEIVHTLTAADHFPLTLLIGVALVSGLLIWRSRR
jgi:hydrogenase/urease accessory protein HupE